MNVLFISEEFLKDITPTGLNVDIKDVYSHLLSAQDVKIQKILGSKLYNELKDAIVQNSITTNQEVLLSHIKYPTAWWAIVFAFRWMNFKVKNLGIQKAHGENSEAAEVPELKWLLEDLNNRAEEYSERLRDYLILNGDKFPSYLNPDVLGEPNRNSQFSSGVYYPSRSNNCCDGIDPQDKGIHYL